MSAARFGPEAGLPAGFAVYPGGTVLLRGHSPGRVPTWFGPAVGERGTNRFDLPARKRASAPGVCYPAATLDGVLLERVIRVARDSSGAARDHDLQKHARSPAGRSLLRSVDPAWRADRRRGSTTAVRVHAAACRASRDACAGRIARVAACTSGRNSVRLTIWRIDRVRRVVGSCGGRTGIGRDGSARRGSASAGGGLRSAWIGLVQ